MKEQDARSKNKTVKLKLEWKMWRKQQDREDEMSDTSNKIPEQMEDLSRFLTRTKGRTKFHKIRNIVHREMFKIKTI